MRVPSFARHTVTILTPGEYNDHGVTRPDWDNVTEVVVPRCLLVPLQGDELIAAGGSNRSGVEMLWKLHLPPGTQITAQDRVRFRGSDYEVHGHPMQWDSPSGALDHVAVYLKRWEG